MCFDKCLKQRDHIIVALLIMAIRICVNGIDLPICPYSQRRRNTIPVAHGAVAQIIDGQDHRLLPLRHRRSLCAHCDRTAGCRLICQTVDINQNIVVVIQRLQNIFKLCRCNHVLPIDGFVFIPVKSKRRIHHQIRKGKMRDITGILIQASLLFLIFCNRLVQPCIPL